MNLPKMILFDYGHTLVYEPYFDSMKYTEEIFKHITKNPNKITVDLLNERRNDFFVEQASILRARDMEVCTNRIEALVKDIYGLEYDISLEELEYEAWCAAEEVVPMEGVEQILLWLRQIGIRTGVISNIAISRPVMERRIRDLFPKHNFEFILTSSEYIYRKPHPQMFQIAMCKAGLSSEEMWYCGDNLITDIECTSQLGFFPVWYESHLECTYSEKLTRKPLCENLHIRHWDELRAYIQKIQDNQK